LVAVTTVVTSPLADAIASAHGIEIRRTLTGFKYIGEQIGLILEEGKDFVLGIEESDGYLKGSYVRDKDGLNALVLVCELASYYKARGKDLVQALDDLYVRYGYVLGRHMSIDYADTSSAVHTGRFMETLRQVPPKKIAGKTVLRVVDYLAESFLSDVLEWNLDGGSRIVIRPSGTEPKIKAYVFASGQNKRMAELLLDELCEGLRMHVLENGGWDL
jgi:phosphoglucomutase